MPYAPTVITCPSCGASLLPVAPEERRIVTVLFADVVGYTTLAEHRDPEQVKRLAGAEIPPDHPSLRLEYLEIVDPENIQPVTKISGPVRVAGALWVGSTRLIDNVLSVPHRQH